MSGHDLIDDYLSELMDDPGKGKPGTSARSSAPSATPAADAAAPEPDVAQPVAPDAPAAPADQDPLAAFRHGSPQIGDDEFEAMLDVLHGKPDTDTASSTPAQPAAADHGDPLAAFREGGDEISEDEFDAMLDALQAPSQTDRVATAAPAAAGDPLAAFRQGSDEIGEDEFEAMLDAMQGKPADAAAATQVAHASPPPGDPLAAFREGSEEIGEDEFEAMLDALQGSTPAASAAAEAPTAAPAPTAPSATSLPTHAIEALLPPSEAAPAHGEPALPTGRRRRAEDRVTSWLRFNLARQCFAVEVLKVQEVLRVPSILPVRGTDEATLGVMNLRGQIVPVMDLAIRLGFPATEPNEASRVIVLEEKGETLGLLVASVADVLNLSEGRMERISGTPSLVAAEVVRGISRRDEQIIIMLDASRLLA
jgi:purine-binding chemotaxis protein CheW